MKKNQKETQKKFEKIRIVSSNYKITYHDIVRDDDGKLLEGRILEAQKEILIDKNLDYQTILQVILHEVIHGIKWEMCFDIKDENINTQLTTGVTCFIRDNPRFIIEYMRVLNNR
jgi:predicted house-cleaning noncanonical NTP pyrophosphatase (MazG superfamily)